jgi:peptide/nickel transport system permease protein
MGTYLIRRLLHALIVIVIVSILVFLAMRLLPGDPILLIVTQDELSDINQEELELLRQEYGLDKPLVTQYFSWVKGVLHGDLGTSIRYRTSVASEIMHRLPITLHLGSLAYIIGLLIGIPAGIICAVRRGKFIDTVVTVVANIGITVPIFWLGIMMMYLFSLQLRWLPVFGYTSPFEDFWLNTRQIIIPVFCITIPHIASITRQTRSSMLEVMRQDYIRTAWAKGLSENLIIIRHGLKNGLIPVITLLGIGLATIIGGSVLIETVFSIPGMGRLAVTSVQNQDYALTQGITLIFSIMIVFSNLLVDIAYGWFDPRMHLEGGGSNHDPSQRSIIHAGNGAPRKRVTPFRQGLQQPGYRRFRSDCHNCLPGDGGLCPPHRPLSA